MRFYAVLLAILLAGFAVPAKAHDLPKGTKRMLELSKYDKLKLNTDIYPTSDGRSYLLVYKTTQNPDHWIVSLPGTRGTATRELEVWYPVLKDRNIGIIVIQWWLGGGDESPRGYYTPRDIYRELDRLIQGLGMRDKTFLLHGFSRGSANIYAVKALDFVTANKYFSLVVANSGGAAMNYPPTQAVDEGAFGAEPFESTRWVTSCGMKDENPDRDGCAAMRRTAEWIKSKGGEVVLQIEDANGGHGALNTNPENARKLLDLFFGK